MKRQTCVMEMTTAALITMILLRGPVPMAAR